MYLPPIHFSRTLIAASLLGALAACGGSSSDPKAAPEVEETPSSEQVSNVLPKVYIQTEGSEPVVTTENYLKGSVRIESEDATKRLQADTKIKGRGNTTWGMPKKPYRLKFNEAQSVLGMPADRNWALLAHYVDKTLVRSKLAMELGEEVDLTYNPRSRFVELYLNDEYQGVYELFEHREVGPNKVAVEELDPEVDDGDEIKTGGYLVEADQRMDEYEQDPASKEICWRSDMQVPFCIKSPDWEKANIGITGHPSQVQYDYITTYINKAEEAMSKAGNSYEEYLDPEAAAGWYLVNELLRNNDAYMHSSVFIHKKRNDPEDPLVGRLTFGPLWDFDISAGNIDYNEAFKTEGWHIRERSPWHRALFTNTDFGKDFVFKKWCKLKKEGVIDGLGKRVDNIVGSIDPLAIDRNFQEWPILGKYVWTDHFIGNTYQEEVDYLKNWLQQRAAWMDAEYTRTYGACPAS